MSQQGKELGEGSGFEPIAGTLESVYRSPGRSVRVMAHVDPSGHAAVNVRGFITPEAYPMSVPITSKRLDRAQWADKHRQAVDEHGGIPNGWDGLKDLSAHQAYELAEALIRAAMAVDEHVLANPDDYR